MLSFWENRLCAFWRQGPIWRISAILDFKNPIMGSLKSPCTTSDRSSITTIAQNCLLFEKIAFFAFWRQTDKQSDKQTDEHMDTTDALSRSRYRERRLNKVQVLASVRLSKAISTPLSGHSGENKPQIISPENRQWFLDRTSDNSFGGHVPSSAHFLLCLPPKNVKSTLA